MKTTYDALAELNRSLKELLTTIAKGLKIYYLLDKFTAYLKK